jgi:hypothetical protein
MIWSGGLAWGRGRPARFGPCGCRKVRHLAKVERPRAGGTPAPPAWWTGLTMTVPMIRMRPGRPVMNVVDSALRRHDPASRGRPTRGTSQR